MRLLIFIGNTAAILGISITLVSGLLRLSGQLTVFGFEAMTLFTGGIALMVFACLAKLQSLQR